MRHVPHVRLPLLTACEKSVTASAAAAAAASTFALALAFEAAAARAAPRASFRTLTSSSSSCSSKASSSSASRSLATKGRPKVYRDGLVVLVGVFDGPSFPLPLRSHHAVMLRREDSRRAGESAGVGEVERA